MKANSKSITTAKHEIQLSEWKERVFECRNSKKKISEWCRDNKINIKTYYHWQRLVWDKETDANQAAASKETAIANVQFAEVEKTRQHQGQQTEIVIHHNNWEIEIKNEANLDLLSRIIQIVNQHV